jgi:hypothetical protein
VAARAEPGLQYLVQIFIIPSLSQSNPFSDSFSNFLLNLILNLILIVCTALDPNHYLLSPIFFSFPFFFLLFIVHNSPPLCSSHVTASGLRNV